MTALPKKHAPSRYKQYACPTFAVVLAICITLITTTMITETYIMGRTGQHLHEILPLLNLTAPLPYAQTQADCPGSSQETFYSEKHNASFPQYLEKWVAFADKHECLVTTGYENLMSQINALAALGPITLQSLEDTKDIVVAPKLINHCKIRSGKMTCSMPNSLCVDQVVGKDMYKPYADLLPDMDFLCDVSDKSVKLHHRKRNDPDRISTPFGGIVPGDVDDAQQQRCLEAGVLEHIPPLPVFSRSWIPGCSGILGIPGSIDTWAPQTLQPGFRDTVSDWDEKVTKVSWVGSPTGTALQIGGKWRESHRLQLVSRFGKQGAFGSMVGTDIAFKGVPGDCMMGGSREECQKLVCAEYTCVGQRKHADQFSAKYIVDVDGNGWSSRFVTQLTSGSVSLKATRYASWWRGRVRPWVHYVPVDMQWKTLNSTVQWLEQNQDVAKRIADSSKEYAMTHLRDIDAQCFGFRALLEYHNLF